MEGLEGRGALRLDAVAVERLVHMKVLVWKEKQ